MDFYKYTNYKELITDLVAQMPKRGRGQYRKLADELRVNTTVISQIFRGDRELSPEQALMVSDFFGFNQDQERFFLILVSKKRAGTTKLQNYYQAQEEKLRQKSQQVKSRIQKHAVIKEEHKALFYSQWQYSGVRMLSALPHIQSVEDIARYFELPRKRVTEIVEFLLMTGLCIEKNGVLTMGPSNTHVGNRSPLVNSHRTNWRLKAIETMEDYNDEDLFFSGPMCLSIKDRKAVREDLLQVISKVLKRVEKSPEEEVSCLNIDWFQF